MTDRSTRLALEWVCADLANQDNLVTYRNQLVRELQESVSVIDLAAITGLSRQAVYNILKKEENSGTV